MVTYCWQPPYSGLYMIYKLGQRRYIQSTWRLDSGLILDELSQRNELMLYELTARRIMKHDLSISRQAIAKHLTTLEDAELVKSKRKGK